MEPDVLLDADVAEFDGLLKPVEVERLRTAIEGVAVLEDRSRQLQDFSLSPLTDSNRRPPLYEEGRVCQLGRVVHRPVRAGAAVVGGELGSSLYRLLIKRTRPIGVSLRWRSSLGTVRRPGGRWRLWERRVGRG
jgi:hypothetical protein